MRELIEEGENDAMFIACVAVRGWEYVYDLTILLNVTREEIEDIGRRLKYWKFHTDGCPCFRPASEYEQQRME